MKTSLEMELDNLYISKEIYNLEHCVCKDSPKRKRGRIQERSYQIKMSTLPKTSREWHARQPTGILLFILELNN